MACKTYVMAPVNNEAVNVIFRAVHSIKSGAGAFGLENLVQFTHQLETVLDELRSGNITFQPDLLRLLFRTADQLFHLIKASRNGNETLATDATNILSHLCAYLQNERTKF